MSYTTFPHFVFKSFFWFMIGASLGLFFLVSFTYITFRIFHKNTIYPGIMINGVNFGGKTQNDVIAYFGEKNNKIADAKFTYSYNNDSITISAKELSYGYNEKLLAQQAYSIGRSIDILSNISLVIQAYANGVNLPPSYHFSDNVLIEAISPLIKKTHVDAQNALFSFKDGRVTAFKPSSEGQDVDTDSIKKTLTEKIPYLIASEKSKSFSFSVPIKIIKPEITTDKVNNLGIKELIGVGTSLFQGSIVNRIHNIALASTRINGVLISPNEVFSFNKVIGDVSAFTGYKQAYVIQDGKTVLGDGGGLCQVSTTLFRSALNAGLPIIERNAHAYRVHYYEEDSPVGLDATVFEPTIDLRFKNDTGNYILVQTVIDPSIARLSFYLYGTKDGRKSIVSTPVITSQTPAPQPLYQDDPNLPKGTIRQIDFSANGANVYFSREVTKDGKTIISEKFYSNYRPWQAIYLRGTKE